MFSAGTPTSSSASSPLRDDSTETPRNPIPQNTVPFLALAGLKRIAPDQYTGMDLYEPWITALGLFNAGERFSGGASQESITDVNLSLGKSVFETSNALSEISK